MSVNLHKTNPSIRWIDEQGNEELASSNAVERDLFSAALVSDFENYKKEKETEKQKKNNDSMNIDNNNNNNNDVNNNNSNNDNSNDKNKDEKIKNEKLENNSDDDNDDDDDWLKVHNNLLQSRVELEHGIAFLDTLRQQYGLACEKQPLEQQAESTLEQNQRISLVMKSQKLASVAAKLYGNVSVLQSQLDIDRVYFEQLSMLSKTWRLYRVPSATAPAKHELVFDYVPSLTVIGDKAALNERATCVCLPDGTLALRLQPHRAAALGASIAVYDHRQQRVATLYGPIEAESADTVATPGGGVEFCDALLQRARQSFWLEKTFQHVSKSL